MTAIASADGHVPYRNSKLTFLLQPSLSRGARVMFIVTASPDAIDAPETIVSLGFGTRARNAQLGAERRVAAAPSAAPSAAGGQTPSAGRIATTPGRPTGKTPTKLVAKSPARTPQPSPRPTPGASLIGNKRPAGTPGEATSACAVLPRSLIAACLLLSPVLTTPRCVGGECQARRTFGSQLICGRTAGAWGAGVAWRRHAQSVPELRPQPLRNLCASALRVGSRRVGRRWPTEHAQVTEQRAMPWQ